MISVIAMVMIAIFSTHDQIPKEAGGTLTIRIESLKNNSGQLGITVYNTSQGWPDKWEQAVRSELIPIESVPTDVTLTALPKGRYAVSVIHDENANSDLDKNFIGIPKEGYAVSNNARPGAFGPPEFEDAAFILTSRDTLISITMNY